MRTGTLPGIGRMADHFITLGWKQWYRSAAFGRSLAIKLVLWLLCAVFLLLMLGMGLVPMLEQKFPGHDPFRMICGGMLFWFLAELALRQLLQSAPTMGIKPLLALPVPRRSIVHFVLARAFLSFILLALMAFILPLAVVLIGRGLPPVQVAGWCIGIVLTSLLLSQLTMLFTRLPWSSFLVPALLIGLVLAQRFHLIDLLALSEHVFHALYRYPLLGLLPLVLIPLVYGLNLRLLLRQLHLGDDPSRPTGSSAADMGAMTWADRFGRSAPFIRLELRMIQRNKRPRGLVWIAPLFILYAYFMYGTIGRSAPGMLFLAIFGTAGFMLNLGQYEPAWDGAYYPLLMSRNCDFHAYLRAKALLLGGSVLVMTMVMLPMLALGPDWGPALLAGALFNIGATLPILLYFGSLLRKRMDFQANAFANWQGVQGSHFLVGFVILIPPMVFYAVGRLLGDRQTGMLLVMAVGALGILLHRPLMKSLVKRYASSKHAMLAGFGQKP